MGHKIECLKLADLDDLISRDQAAQTQLEIQLDAIFFATSNRKSFASSADRDAFRNLWLGQYLARDRRHAFVAVDRKRAEVALGHVVGYLVGCLEHPLSEPRFATLGYFADFSAECDAYPAHLHINMDADCRGLGMGSRLIAMFTDHAAASGAPGMHVTTDPDSRNVQFYARCGFVERARTRWRGNDIAFLGCDLSRAG